MALGRRREAIVQNIPGVVAVLNSIPKTTMQELRTAFKKDALEWDGAMQERFRTGIIKTNSGRLQGSFGHAVPGRTLADLKLRVFSRGLPYARVQEYGYIFRPVRAKYLTVPGPDNLTPAGVKRYPSAREFIDKHKDSTAFIKDKSGKVWIVWYPRGRKRQKMERGRLMWLLRKQVVVPGPNSTQTPSRLGFFSTWDKLAPERRVRHEEALARVVKEASSIKRSSTIQNVRFVRRRK